MSETGDGSTPDQPVRTGPEPGWEHYQLFERVKDSIYSIPSYFSTETTIAGILATDIFTLGAVLSATIEEQVVLTLNGIRPIWDPDERYATYSFRRRAQTFPDVVLARDAAPDDIIMGIELKAWYLLAKEREPNFRYKVTPSVCAPADLLVIVPWVLSNIVTGSPKILAPYIESARYVAEYRNYYWQFARTTTGNREIRSPSGVCPYPPAKANVSDEAVSDSGKNFGRASRTGIMDSYINTIMRTRLLGIEAEYWHGFFKVFTEETSPEETESKFGKMVARIATQRTL